MGQIIIEGMEFYAYHGHFAEEQIVGGKFIVDITIDTDTEKAGKSDSLLDALDYQDVYKTIKTEMETKSFLLENIAYRIINKLFEKYLSISAIVLKVSKINPPLGGKIEKVSVRLEKKFPSVETDGRDKLTRI
ncbi:MAG: dihydroneopterin aldolase [Bacteroidetes bacterium GWA2_32_17]|nr:MAG: dihydroneopterin aldolase [Bacteroidetes bacterium GWA2_32_17]